MLFWGESREEKSSTHTNSRALLRDETEKKRPLCFEVVVVVVPKKTTFFLYFFRPKQQRHHHRELALCFFAQKFCVPRER